MRGSWVRYGDCHHCHRVVAHGAFLACGRLMPARFASCQPTGRGSCFTDAPFRCSVRTKELYRGGAPLPSAAFCGRHRL